MKIEKLESIRYKALPINSVLLILSVVTQYLSLSIYSDASDYVTIFDLGVNLIQIVSFAAMGAFACNMILAKEQCEPESFTRPFGLFMTLTASISIASSLIDIQGLSEHYYLIITSLSLVGGLITVLMSYGGCIKTIGSIKATVFSFMMIATAVTSASIIYILG